MYDYYIYQISSESIQFKSVASVAAPKPGWNDAVVIWMYFTVMQYKTIIPKNNNIKAGIPYSDQKARDISETIPFLLDSFADWNTKSILSFPQSFVVLRVVRTFLNAVLS